MAERIKSFFRDAEELAIKLRNRNEGEVLHEIRQLLDSSIVSAADPTKSGEVKEEEVKQNQSELKERTTGAVDNTSPPVFGE